MVKMGQILKAKKAKQDTLKSMPGREGSSRSGSSAFAIDKVRKTPAGKGPRGR
jgi:hypothetical protein